MIAKLTGALITKAVDHVVLDVRDVGYRVFIPLSTYCDLPELDAVVSLFIHTYVREDIFQLFGFLTVDERDLFEALLRVTKVGPKLALAMLSGMSANDLRQSVSVGDVPRLSTVPGVGRKTAERIVLELRERFAKEQPEPVLDVGALGNGRQVAADAVTALQNLGYARTIAEHSIRQALHTRETLETPSLKDLVREALRFIGREKGG
jgi:holliday junction DNA helicase RuvA